jgi:hypothetical protein
MSRPKRTLGRTIREGFEDDTDVKFQPIKWLLWVFAVVIVLSLIGWLFGWISQPFRTAAGVREKVGNADNVLYQYEHFHDLCAAVRSTDTKIAAYDKRHPDGDDSDKFQAAPKRDRLDTELTGLKQFRAERVEQYNADSAKANRSLFKDNSLPARLDESTPACN